MYIMYIILWMHVFRIFTFFFILFFFSQTKLPVKFCFWIWIESHSRNWLATLQLFGFYFIFFVFLSGINNDRRCPDPEIPVLKTWNPDMPNLKKKKSGSRKERLRNLELKNTQFRRPEKWLPPLSIWQSFDVRSTHTCHFFYFVWP